jgi:transketolase
MVSNISLREAFGRALVKAGGERDDFVVFDADVAGGTCAHYFREAFPDRFFQCGIAEQNMMSVAAGISTLGITPVVTTYAVFASMRAVEQARNSIAYPNFNVKVVASHVGLDTGPDGPTHQSMEDIAIYRAIANFKVIGPGDPSEVEGALDAILDHEGPVYMRTGRSPVPSVLPEDYRFQLGRGSLIKDGDDATIIATGVMLHRALAAAALLEKEGLMVGVVNMSTLKPLDEELIIERARKTGHIVTAEDHNVIGGLGGGVAEVLSQWAPVPMRMVGIRDTFAESGSPDDLAEKYGLTAGFIAAKVREVLKWSG